MFLILNCYYRIHDKPAFSIFEPKRFTAGLGGVEAARAAMDWMRQRCRERGLPGVELQAIARKEDRGPDGPARPLGFDSATAYQFCMDSGETGDYVTWAGEGHVPVAGL